MRSDRSPCRSRRLIRAVGVIPVAVTGLVLTAAAPAPATAPAPAPAISAPTAPIPTASAETRQSRLVVAEDNRLKLVQTALRQAHRRNAEPDPFRVPAAGGETLVLTARSAPYTLDELASTDEDAVSVGPYGFLVTKNLVVDEGATLQLTPPSGWTDALIGLVSDSRAFVSVVSLGGQLLVGTPGQGRLSVTSWDRASGHPDLDVSDGRAYLRADGGGLLLHRADVGQLGFWSGRTGGVAVTPGETVEATTRPAVAMTDSTIEGDAFGAFLSGAGRVDVTNTSVAHSLVDGVVLHGGTTGVRIRRSSSNGNGGDGFVVARGSSAVELDETTASGNAGHGFFLSGQALADGPSESGAATTSYGQLQLNRSLADGNGGAGVMVAGGYELRVSSNTFSRNAQGVVVRSGTDGLSVDGNRFEQTARDAVVVTGSQNVRISDNTFNGSRQAVVVRDARVDIAHNTVTGATVHGFGLSGAVAGTTVENNTLAGKGSDPIDLRRVAAGQSVRVEGNDITHWLVDRSVGHWLRNNVQPITGLWGGVFMVLVLGLVQRRRLRREQRHPYWRTQPAPELRTGGEAQSSKDPVVDLAAPAETRARETVHSS